MEVKIKDIAVRELRTNNGEVEGLPRNPRKISKKQLEKLKKSVKDAPEMLRLRELIVVPHGDVFVVIAGNQRLEAAKALGMEMLPCKVLPADTNPAKLREYAIKDNLPFGEDDWDVLFHSWDTAELENWGFDLSLPDTSRPDPKDVELRPFKCSHILLSYDIDKHDMVIEKIFELVDILGDKIEITTAAN